MKVTLSQYKQFNADYWDCKFPMQRYGQAFIVKFYRDVPYTQAQKQADLKLWNTLSIGEARHIIEHHFLEH